MKYLVVGGGAGGGKSTAGAGGGGGGGGATDHAANWFSYWGNNYTITVGTVGVLEQGLNIVLAVQIILVSAGSNSSILETITGLPVVAAEVPAVMTPARWWKTRRPTWWLWWWCRWI